MSRTRAIVALLALLLALPSVALGQGAGDEQYQDPFGDEQTQGGGGNGGGGNGGGSGPSGQAAQDDGLSDDPPVDGGDETPADPGDEGGTDGGDEGATGGDEERTLPNTGSDPRLLAWCGLLFLMVGVGLRLRTIDPDDF